MYTYLLRLLSRLLGEKFLGDTRVWFLVCSSFSPLTSQTVLESLVGWVAPNCRFQRRRLAVNNDVPTPSHTNRRD